MTYFSSLLRDLDSGGGCALSKAPPHFNSSHASNLEKWRHILRCSHLDFDGHTIDLWRGTLKGQKVSASVALVTDTGAHFLSINALFPSQALQNGDLPHFTDGETEAQGSPSLLRPA